jgi:hypothetical protein
MASFRDMKVRRVDVHEIQPPSKQAGAEQITPLRKDGLVANAHRQLFPHGIQHRASL